jgi:hypothetical protein
MAWVQTGSDTFRARHDSADAGDAREILHALELIRGRLEDLLPRHLEEMTVVLHGSVSSLMMTNPTLPVTWLATAPAARRYVAGWVGANELHVLSPAVLRSRASNVPGSREMLALSAPALYARRLIAENNRDLQRVMIAVRVRRELRWAWLLDGAARWLSGQTEHARPAIARRLRESGRPSFPPGLRDAPLLGGTLIDLLAREEGERAVIRMSTRLDPAGPRAALSKAFSGRSLSETEKAWRSHLARLATAV